MDVRVGLWRRLSAEELMRLNCGVGEDSWESLGLQGDPTSPFWNRSALGFLWREWCEAETPVVWPPHAKSWLIGKDFDAGRDWGWEKKGMTEDEMAGCEFEWTLGGGDGQGGLTCCDSWGRRESDTTEWLNWTELNRDPNYNVLVKVTKSCPTLHDPMDFSLPGSSFHGILQAGILEWVAISFSRVSSQPRDWTEVSGIAGGFVCLFVCLFLPSEPAGSP